MKLISQLKGIVSLETSSRPTCYEILRFYAARSFIVFFTRARRHSFYQLSLDKKQLKIKTPLNNS